MTRMMPAVHLRTPLPRRTVLRGLGASLALPFLEMMGSSTAQAQSAAAGPRRLVYLYSPNGRDMARWTPRGLGRDFSWTPTLEPFAALKDHLTIITGLDNDPAKARGQDGPGGHARANATFLSGVYPFKTSGADVRAGITVDQVLAQRLGRATRLPSLELGCDSIRRAGRCDSGYACAYQYNLSWQSPTMPRPPETNPRAVFAKLTQNLGEQESPPEQARRLTQRRSVLDYVLSEAKKIERQVGVDDRQKLDEYFTSVRELERRLEQWPRSSDVETSLFEKMPPPPDLADSDGTYPQQLDLMFDLLALALQSDSTRIATFLMASETSLRTFAHLGISENHHFLSHHQGNDEKLAKQATIDRWYAERVARFLTQLEQMKETAGGTVLDHSMIVYGCGIADGNDHGHDNLPILLAGGVTRDPGRHLELSGPVPLSNLHRTLAAYMGAPLADFGDSNGLMTEL